VIFRGNFYPLRAATAFLLDTLEVYRFIINKL
jgi:hypothetical protein